MFMVGDYWKERPKKCIRHETQCGAYYRAVIWAINAFFSFTWAIPLFRFCRHRRSASGRQEDDWLVFCLVSCDMEKESKSTKYSLLRCKIRPKSPKSTYECLLLPLLCLLATLFLHHISLIFLRDWLALFSLRQFVSSHVLDLRLRCDKPRYSLPQWPRAYVYHGCIADVVVGFLNVSKRSEKIKTIREICFCLSTMK